MLNGNLSSPNRSKFPTKPFVLANVYNGVVSSRAAFVALARLSDVRH